MIERNVLLVLGNGISIDLVNKIGKTGQINLTNLFANGDKVPWPQNDEPGFLSQHRCPCLWEIGARPNMDQRKANKIIEDIITCANVSASSENPSINNESSNIYIRAYHELVMYLKYLFIYYNTQITDADLRKMIENKWGWSALLNNLKANTSIKKVTIITYNYDILIERIMHELKIPYQVVGFDTDLQKFQLIKPHGSISFRSKRLSEKSYFKIKYNRDSLGGSIDDLQVDEDVDWNKISTTNTMIPPAGESDRYKSMWSNALQMKSIAAAKELQDEDIVIFGGLSYCNVDRREIDKLITSLDSDVNVKVVNPNVESTFGAVLSSVFDHYVHYTCSDILGGLYK